jgi:predicted transcriptional regulator
MSKDRRRAVPAPEPGWAVLDSTLEVKGGRYTYIYKLIEKQAKSRADTVSLSEPCRECPHHIAAATAGGEE